MIWVRYCPEYCLALAACCAMHNASNMDTNTAACTDHWTHRTRHPAPDLSILTLIESVTTSTACPPVELAVLQLEMETPDHAVRLAFIVGLVQPVLDAFHHGMLKNTAGLGIHDLDIGYITFGGDGKRDCSPAFDAQRASAFRDLRAGRGQRHQIRATAPTRAGALAKAIAETTPNTAASATPGKAGEGLAHATDIVEFRLEIQIRHDRVRLGFGHRNLQPTEPGQPGHRRRFGRCAAPAAPAFEGDCWVSGFCGTLTTVTWAVCGGGSARPSGGAINQCITQNKASATSTADNKPAGKRTTVAYRGCAAIAMSSIPASRTRSMTCTRTPLGAFSSAWIMTAAFGFSACIRSTAARTSPIAT